MNSAWGVFWQMCHHHSLHIALKYSSFSWHISCKNPRRGRDNKVCLSIGKVNWSLKKKITPRVSKPPTNTTAGWSCRASLEEEKIKPGSCCQETSRTEVSNGLGLIQPLSVTGEWCGGHTGWGGGFAWQNVHFNCSFSFFFFFKCDLIANYAFCICN